MPAKGGTSHPSHAARHFIGGIKVRPDNQYFFRWPTHLKPGARMSRAAVSR
jgi:hypothetical protein